MWFKYKLSLSGKVRAIEISVKSNDLREINKTEEAKMRG